MARAPSRVAADRFAHVHEVPEDPRLALNSDVRFENLEPLPRRQGLWQRGLCALQEFFVVRGYIDSSNWPAAISFAAVSLISPALRGTRTSEFAVLPAARFADTRQAGCPRRASDGGWKLGFSGRLARAVLYRCDILSLAGSPPQPTRRGSASRRPHWRSPSWRVHEYLHRSLGARLPEGKKAKGPPR